MTGTEAGEAGEAGAVAGETGAEAGEAGAEAGEAERPEPVGYRYRLRRSIEWKATLF